MKENADRNPFYSIDESLCLFLFDAWCFHFTTGMFFVVFFATFQVDFYGVMTCQLVWISCKN